MPNFRLLAPGILLLKTPEVAPFIPFSDNPKRHLLYNAGKLTDKLNQKKHVIEALYDLAWGDIETILKNFENCENDAEKQKALAELISQVALASSTGGELETAKEGVELFATGMLASQQLDSYQARAALLKAAADSAAKQGFMPADLKQMLDAIIERNERPSSFSLTLRLRGPKPGETQFNVPNKPPSDKAFDRWTNFFSGKNVTNVNNIGRGGGQPPVGIQFQLDELTELNQFEQLASLIFKNAKKMLFCAIISGVVYIIFKKRSALKRFLTPLKQLIKKIYLIYKRVTKNRLINNGVTRRILIFSRALNRI